MSEKGGKKGEILETHNHLNHLNPVSCVKNNNVNLLHTLQTHSNAVSASAGTH